MKKLCYLFCLLALALVGCKTQKIPGTLPPVVLNNSDSVRVETIVNTVYVPVEVAVDLPRQSESNATHNDSSHVETDLAFSDAWIYNGILHHNIENKPGKLKGEAYVPQTTEQTSKESVKVKEVPVPQPYPIEVERKMTLMEQIKLAAFWYLVGAALISACYIFRKPLLLALRKVFRL